MHSLGLGPGKSMGPGDERGLGGHLVPTIYFTLGTWMQ